MRSGDRDALHLRGRNLSGSVHEQAGDDRPATGQTTVNEQLLTTTDGIAVTSGALPPASAIPTLSEWAQIAMIAGLVVVGLEALRRRRAALR